MINCYERCIFYHTLQKGTAKRRELNLNFSTRMPSVQKISFLIFCSINHLQPSLQPRFFNISAAQLNLILKDTLREYSNDKRHRPAGCLTRRTAVNHGFQGGYASERGDYYCGCLYGKYDSVHETMNGTARGLLQYVTVAFVARCIYSSIPYKFQLAMAAFKSSTENI